jgi:hypothetical protein
VQRSQVGVAKEGPKEGRQLLTVPSAWLPALGIALCVEAGNYQNPTPLNFEEYSVGKSPHSCTSASTMHNRNLQRVLRNRINRVFDRQSEALSELGPYVVIPRSGVLQLGFGLW